VTPSFDAVVCGAGPAGAYLAHLLSKKGIQTLLMDKARFPRYKPCGGGLTRRAIDLLPFDLSGIVEDWTVKARIGLRSCAPLAIEVPEPMIGMVMRDRFDHFLVEKAREAGALFWEGCAVGSIERTMDGFRLETGCGVVTARCVAGADGVMSRVRRCLGLSPNTAVPALEAEVHPRRGTDLDRFRMTVDFDFWAVPRGYGWVFPKADHLSIGVFSTDRKVPGMRRYLHAYLARKGISHGYEVRSIQGHLIPTGPPGTAGVVPSGAFLLGDAAGLCDPITGEGIYHALRQAEGVSCAMERHLAGDAAASSLYEDAVRREFSREIRPARRLAFLLYRMPWVSDRLLEAMGERIMGYHLDVIAGRATYRQVFRKALLPGTLLRVLPGFGGSRPDGMMPG